MNDFRRALIEAEQDMITEARVARARRRVAARLEAPTPSSKPWMQRWAPVIATVACVASALVIHAVVFSEDGDEVTPVAEPVPEELPDDAATPRPGFASRPPPIPTVDRVLPPAPSVKVRDDDEPTGTLVAIAIGGSCSFTVDGEAKGTSSSIRLTVPVGRHTVACTPPGGATRSQSINVKDGKPGIASFRIN
jgi:serine/threonine-protein kinase